jgi:hypothetical protein
MTSRTFVLRHKLYMMNTEKLSSLTIENVDDFYRNSIDPSNTDGWLIQYNFNSIKKLRSDLSRNAGAVNLFNSFLNNYYPLKHEYVVVYSNLSMFVTNFRMMVLDNNIPFSILLNDITYYGEQGNNCIIKYMRNGIETIYYPNEWIPIAYVNNAIQAHKNEIFLLTDDQKEILNSKKVEIDIKHGIHVTSNFVPVEAKRNINYKGLMVLLLFVSCFGWCVYSFSSDTSTSTSNTSSNEYCSKHEVTYSLNNAYGGCPKCVKEKQAKDAAEAMERKMNLN